MLQQDISLEGFLWRVAGKSALTGSSSSPAGDAAPAQAADAALAALQASLSAIDSLMQRGIDTVSEAQVAALACVHAVCFYMALVWRKAVYHYRG